MIPKDNETISEDTMFSKLDLLTYIYLLMVVVFSLVPLVTLCVCGLRFCIDEITWEREFTRKEHLENVRSLIMGTRRVSIVVGSRTGLRDENILSEELENCV